MAQLEVYFYLINIMSFSHISFKVSKITMALTSSVTMLTFPINSYGHSLFYLTQMHLLTTQILVFTSLFALGCLALPCLLVLVSSRYIALITWEALQKGMCAK